VALRATGDQRQMRKRRDMQEPPAVPPRAPPSNLLEDPRRHRTELLAMHRRRFDEVNAQMAAGDTER